jgi:MFS family permease
MGLNECAGYVAVAGAAIATGWIAARTGHLRPEPFYPGVVFVLAGLGLSAAVIRETAPHVALESNLRTTSERAPTPREVFWRTSIADRNLSSISQAGLVNNLNDGMAWGLFPLVFAGTNMTLTRIGALAAIYPATWGVAQLATGIVSDRIGRKWLIAGGMWVQAAGIGVITISRSFAGFAAGAVLLGVGTAMVYPTLLAAIGDVAHPAWRASAVGVYRFWRDLGYAIGALVAGITADLLGPSGAMWVVAAITAASGLLAATRMRETHVC